MSDGALLYEDRERSLRSFFEQKSFFIYSLRVFTCQQTMCAPFSMHRRALIHLK